MERRDYLMKQFEQLGIVLASLLGFKASAKYQKGLEAIGIAYSEIPGFDKSLLNEPDPKKFIAKILAKQPVSFQRLELIANFIFEEGEFLFLSGNETYAKDRYNKALLIFNYLNENEKIYSIEREDKISKITKLTASD